MDILQMCIPMRVFTGWETENLLRAYVTWQVKYKKLISYVMGCCVICVVWVGDNSM